MTGKGYPSAFDASGKPLVDLLPKLCLSIRAKLTGQAGRNYFIDREIEIAFIEEFGVISDHDILQFEEPDITRWFTTSDYFNMNVWINDHKFIISSDLYSILEQVYQFKFHENIYRIELI